jgi:hypothetical protein
VYDRFRFGFTLPASLNFECWIRSAPAWADWQGELDERGRPQIKIGPYDTGKVSVCYSIETGQGYVSGGLQSFCYGHNSGPFQFAEAQAALAAIATLLLLPAEALRVHSLETGATVPTGEAPTSFLARIARAHHGSKQKMFTGKTAPANATDTLEFEAVFSQYRVKIYDKGTYNRLKHKPLPPGPTGNGFRFEIHYRKAEKLAAVLGWRGTITAAHLMQPDVFTRLASALLQSWRDIHMPSTVNLPDLSIDERALLIAGSEPDFWESAKRNTPEATYKRKRSLFLRLQKQQAATGSPMLYTADLEQAVGAALPVQPGYQN